MQDLPTPPYFVVIFTAELVNPNEPAYHAMASQLRELVAQQPGYLGMHSVCEQNREITLSYWQDRASIRAWKAQPLHRQAQLRGQQEWYRWYRVEIARVE